MLCKKCESQIAEGAAFCPFCGADQKNPWRPPPLVELGHIEGQQDNAADKPKQPPTPSKTHPAPAAWTWSAPLDSTPIVKRNGYAAAAMVCGLLSSCTYGVTGVLAVILGWAAIKQIRGAQERQEGMHMAITGMALGGLTLLIYGASMFYVIVSAI